MRRRIIWERKMSKMNFMKVFLEFKAAQVGNSSRNCKILRWVRVSIEQQQQLDGKTKVSNSEWKNVPTTNYSYKYSWNFLNLFRYNFFHFHLPSLLMYTLCSALTQHTRVWLIILYESLDTAQHVYSTREMVWVPQWYLHYFYTIFLHTHSYTHTHTQLATTLADIYGAI